MCRAKSSARPALLTLAGSMAVTRSRFRRPRESILRLDEENGESVANRSLGESEERERGLQGGEEAGR